MESEPRKEVDPYRTHEAVAMPLGTVGLERIDQDLLVLCENASGQLTTLPRRDLNSYAALASALVL